MKSLTFLGSSATWPLVAHFIRREVWNLADIVGTTEGVGVFVAVEHERGRAAESGFAQPGSSPHRLETESSVVGLNPDGTHCFRSRIARERQRVFLSQFAKWRKGRPGSRREQS